MKLVYSIITFYGKFIQILCNRFLRSSTSWIFPPQKTLAATWVEVWVVRRRHFRWNILWYIHSSVAFALWARTPSCGKLYPPEIYPPLPDNLSISWIFFDKMFALKYAPIIFALDSVKWRDVSPNFETPAEVITEFEVCFSWYSGSGWHLFWEWFWVYKSDPSHFSTIQSIFHQQKNIWSILSLERLTFNGFYLIFKKLLRNFQHF